MLARLWMFRPTRALALRMIEPSRPLPARQVWDVGALLLATGDLLQARFGAVTVRGELSGLTRPASGHRYFFLKDMAGGNALLRCAMFRRAAALLDFDAQDGQQVELRGRLAIYEPRGELQMVVESVQRLGAGALYERFLHLKAKLESDGLFDPARKRPIPRWPARLGIVTSLAAAALHDVLAALARRAPHLHVIIYPSAVQGAEAPPALAAALCRAAERGEVDCLLLVRGGGSLEDLWAFNDEGLVRAIVASPIPVISGVGHESDVTLADLAADLRAATPTAAAELAAPAQAEALARLDALATALLRRARQLTDTQAQRLDTLALRLGAPARGLELHRQALHALEGRLGRALREATASAARSPSAWGARLVRAMRQQCAAQAVSLQAAAQRLAALDPRSVLARGYAWVVDEAGRPVLSVDAVAPGDRLRAVWADGSAEVDVRQVRRGAPA
jgi:exodeoxyribonuclease VII large subunit